MASLQTFFRAVVMLATLGLLATAWYHYGPSFGELQTLGNRAVQVADEAWADYWQSPGDNLPLAADEPHSAAPLAPFVPPVSPVQPPPLPTTPPQPFAGQPDQLAGHTAMETTPASPPAASLHRLPSTARLEPLTDPTADDQLQRILERLAQYGVRDQQLKPWGSRGEVVRFTCSVPWFNSLRYTRQFEAVATSPLAAVEQVATEIEAWRGSQHHTPHSLQ